MQPPLITPEAAAPPTKPPRTNPIKESATRSEKKTSRDGPRERKLRELFDKLSGGSTQVSAEALRACGAKLDFVGANLLWSTAQHNKVVARLVQQSGGGVSQGDFAAAFSEALPQVHVDFLEVCGILAQAVGEEGSPRASPSRSSLAERSGGGKASMSREARLAQLRKVYREFDLDGGGDVGYDELLALGQARRDLGQKEGVWTKRQNDQLMKSMGAKNGTVSLERFCEYFHDVLPQDEADFKATMKKFLLCAKAIASGELRPTKAVPVSPRGGSRSPSWASGEGSEYMERQLAAMGI